MRTLEVFAIQLTLVCATCNGVFQAPGLVDSVLCPTCARITQLRDEDWSGMTEELLLTALFRGPSMDGYDVYGKGFKARIDVCRRRAVCPSCSAELDPASFGSGAFQCDCGEPISVRGATALASDLMPGALWLVGEGVVGGAVPQDPQAPIGMSCSSCGGELPLDDAVHRGVACRYCSTHNVVPDDLWIRLHPLLEPWPFHLVATHGEREALVIEQRRRQHDVARKKRKPLYAHEAELASAWPSPPQDALAAVLSSRDPDARVGLVELSALPNEVLAALAGDKDASVREAVAARRDLPEALGLTLARDATRRVREALVENRETSAAVLAVLVDHDDDRLRRKIAEHPQVTPLLLARLAVADCPEAKALLAETDDPEVLTLFASSSSFELRHQAGRHPATPLEALSALADSPDEQIRHTLLERHHLPEALQLRLAERPEHRPRVLERQDCPVELLVDATASNEPKLQRLAARHASTPENAIDSLAARATDSGVVRELYKRISPHTDRVIALATAASPELRVGAARRHETGIELLRALANDPEPDVRAAVADRRDLPTPLVLQLAGDASVQVSTAAREQPAWISRERRRRLVMRVVVAGVVLGLGSVVAVALGLGAVLTRFL